jgi:glycosyltransferase involved in cell wall biosynthesis
MMKPRLLIVCQSNNSLKGTEKVLMTIAAGLCTDYEVHFLALDKESPSLSHNDVLFHYGEKISWWIKCIPKNLAVLVRNVLTIDRVIKKIKPDYVISSLDSINIATGILIPFHKSSRFVATVHTNPEICLTGLKRFLAQKLFPKFAYVICASQGTRQALLNICPGTKTRTIYNPVPGTQFPGKKVHGISKLIFVGNLTLNKGIHHLLRVLTTIPKANRPQLNIFGVGELELSLKSYVQKNNLQEAVNFCGLDKNVSARMKEADALVLPTYSEAFGLVLVEALKAGTPIITSDANFGPREILDITPEKIQQPITTTSSGILLQAPSYTLDDADLDESPLTPFELTLKKALLTTHIFSVDVSLTERFNEEVIIKQWRDLLTELKNE